jgi:pullulanase
LFLTRLWLLPTRAQADPTIASGDIRVHYHRSDGNYSGWTIYAFDNTTENTGDYGGGPVQVSGTDSYGAYFDVGVNNFGVTYYNQIGPNASQVNLYGYGIGTFNDRIRDGVRGGSPFTDERVQGFATGLFTDPSDFTNSALSASQQQAQLLQYSDWIDVGLTGNLRDYTFLDSAGVTVTGAEVSYNGQPTGYTKSPMEAVNYASVHDNQDLFEAVQVKASFGDSIATRARRQIMGMSLVTLGQGIPFFQGGDDLLRS